LKAAGLDLNRKVLADIALHDEAGFLSLVQAAKAALDAKPGPEAETAHAPEAKHAPAEPALEAKPAAEVRACGGGRAPSRKRIRQANL